MQNKSSKNQTLSVVIATFNGENYISQQLESILCQSVKPDEIIVVDDCSIDNTLPLVKKTLSQSKIPYKIIVHKKNCGINKTFEDGINSVSSKYVMLSDQDDYWKSNKIKVTKEILCSYEDASLVVCNASIVDSNLNITSKTLFDSINLNITFEHGVGFLTKEQMQQKLLKRNYITGMCIGTKKEYLKGIKFPEGVLYDYWLAWTLSAYGRTVFINEELVLYRQHKDNVIGAKTKNINPDYFRNRLKNKIRWFNTFNCFLKLPYIDERTKVKIKQAIEFNHDRLTICNINSCKALIIIIKNVFNLSYFNFTARPVLEISKDIVDVFLL